MQQHIKSLFQKNGLTTMYMARKLLGKQIGDRMEKIVDIASTMNVGRGTVQTAIKNLEDAGAISLEVRGHLGTFITAINYAILLNVSGMSHLVGVMPLPYSKRYEGLATGIYHVLNEEAGVPVNLAFMPGAARRIDSLLEERYNFAVVSWETAEHYVSENGSLEILFVLNNHTYVNEHALIYHRDYNGTQEGMRIGVDYSSFDQMSMTTRYFKDKSIELIPMKYSSIIDNIKKREIDGAIWSLEERILKEPDLQYEIIHSVTGLKNTQAAVLIHKEDDGTRNFMNRFFIKGNVEEIQRKVVEEDMLPNY